MPHYIIAYHSDNKPESPEAGAEQMAKWKRWIDDLGDGVSDDGESNPMSSFSVVQTDSMEAALEIARNCPFLETGGTLEVADMMKM